MNLIKTLKEIGSEHGSTICTIGAIVGLGLTIYETWKVRPKVDKLLDEDRKEKNEIEKCEDLSEEEKKAKRKEITISTAKKTAVACLPLAGASIGTAGLTITSHLIDSRKIADMAATITLGETAYQKLANKTREIVGDEKADEIQRAIAEDDVKKMVTNELMTDEGMYLDVGGVEQGYGGDQMFYDATFGRTFLSDVHTIMKVIDEFNRNLYSGKEKYYVYNEFFANLGLRQVPAGDYVGWGVYSPDANRLEPNMANTIRIGDRSCIVLDWIVRPSTSFK